MLPSPFVVAWLPRARQRVGPEPRALDVATGRGRHLVEVARSGFRTFGVDIRFDALHDASAAATAAGAAVSLWCADLTMHPLPRDRFDLIVVTRYLQRDLFPALGGALRRGGLIIYETFTEAQRAHGVGPKSPDHLLRAGEMRDRFADLEVLFYEEVAAPEALARSVARRR